MSREERNGVTRRDLLKTSAVAGAAAATSAAVGGLISTPSASAAPMPPGEAPASNESYEGDLILYNGRIHTMDDGNHVVSVIGIQDGTINYVGDNFGGAMNQFSGRPRPKTVDLTGRMACPGIIDATNHISLLGNRPGHHTPLEYAHTIADVLALFAARARGIPPSPVPPVVASNFVTTLGDFAPQQLKEQRLPTLAELDKAVPNNGAYITVGFNGPSVTNTLGKAFFENAQPFPVTVGDDGSIAQGDQTGRATFALRQTLTFDQRMQGFRDSMAFLASVGLTTNIETGAFQTTNSPADNVASEDNYTYNQPALAVYAAGQGTVRMRIEFLHQDTDPSLPTLTQRVLNAFQFTGDDMVRTGGIGEWIAGVPSSPVFTDACVFLAKNRWRAKCQGLSARDAAAEILAYQTANAQYPITDLRWAIVHSNLTTDQLDQLQALGAGVTCSGYHYLTGTGPAAGPPYRVFFDHGIHVGMDSDAADISMFSPWLQMYYATTGLNALGQQINPGQQVTRQEALFHYTNANTWFVGPPDGLGPADGDLLGVLEVGRHGDVLVLSDDFFAVSDEAVKDIHSVLTVVNGKIVHTGPVSYAA